MSWRRAVTAADRGAPVVLLLLLALVVGVVHVRDDHRAASAAGASAAQAAAPSAQATTQLLDELRLIGMGALVDLAEREELAIVFDEHLWPERRIYGQTRPRRDPASGRLDLTVVLDGTSRQRGPIAAATLAHELEHVWQFRNRPEQIVDDCPESEVAAYAVEARALRALLDRYGEPVGGLRAYERAVLAAHDTGDWQTLRALARRLSCPGARARAITSRGGPRTSMGEIAGGAPTQRPELSPSTVVPGASPVAV